MTMLPPVGRGARFGGWTVSCTGDACTATTAEQAPGPYWRADEDRAVMAAKALGWVHVRTALGDVAWYCPIHQAWDADTRRWVPASDGLAEAEAS